MRKLLFFVFLSLAVFGIQAWAADLTGTWQAAVETDAGSGSPTFVFQQTGDQLTGTYAGALGEAKLKGTVTGDKVQFMFDVSPSGEVIHVVYSATLDGNNKMKGTVKLGSMGEGTFTAVKGSK